MAPQKPHIMCIPAPLQGHINPMLKLAKLLHSKGFYITFILTEFDFSKLTSSMASEFSSLQTLHDFRVETIPDGLPWDDKRGVLELPGLCQSFLGDEPKKAVQSLLMRLLGSTDNPPISSIILDGVMFFALAIGKELGIPVMLFFTTSACGMLAYMHYDELVERGHFPLRDESYLTNGYLETPIDWEPGLIKGTKLKHFPTFLRSTNPNDTLFNYLNEAARSSFIADGMILNTFTDLEAQALDSIKAKIPNLYIVGPLSLHSHQDLNNNGHEHGILPRSFSLWKEEIDCIEWLDTKSPRSLVYVNYGSLAILTLGQLEEFAWGLANSNHSFLWVIRSDLVEGVSSVITEEYKDRIQGRGLISGWCPQEKVLQHPSVAVFLTHCGWNSMLESICEGVPMICWPFFAEQQTNCLYACQEWKIGMEMEEGEVRREKVEGLVKEMMEGDKGKEIKTNALEWKKKAQETIKCGGSSKNDFDELVKCLVKNKSHHQ